MAFFDNYQELCRSKGKSANGVAKELGLPSSSVTQWKHGTTPRAQTLDAIAEYFHVSVKELMYGKEKSPAPKQSKALSAEALDIARQYDAASPMIKNIIKAIFSAGEIPEVKKPTKVVPLFGQSFAAGTPETAGDLFASDYETEDMRAEFAIHVNGDSMEPYLPDGSVALGVKRYPKDGEVGAFFLDGGFLVKQICVDSQSNVYLFSLNRSRADADDTIWASSGRDLRVVGTILMDKKIPLPD